MRPIHWMFVISIFLFVSGVVFVVAAERTARAAAPQVAAVEVRAAEPLATVKQIMQGMVMPASSVIWDSVSTIVSEAGVEEKMPRTDAEWEEVGTSAAMLVESANLLLQGPRAVDTGDWPKMARAMADSAKKALQAVEARSTQGILDVGEEINKTCDNCHERYSRE